MVDLIKSPMFRISYISILIERYKVKPTPFQPCRGNGRWGFCTRSPLGYAFMAYPMILIRGACHYVEPQNTNTTLQVHRGGLDAKKPWSDIVKKSVDGICGITFFR